MSDSRIQELTEQYLNRKHKKTDTEKQCNNCKEIKDITEYAIHSKKKDGSTKYRAKCKKCVREYNKARYKKIGEQQKLKQYIKYHLKKSPEIVNE